MAVTLRTTHSTRSAPIVTLDDPLALAPEVVGAKAAHLARARRAGLPVLDGFVITTHAAGRWQEDEATLDLLRAAWERLAACGTRPLVVRSSSVAEDGSQQSMAGLFTSVLDVRSWHPFLAAVESVIASAAGAAASLARPVSGPSMAVLVQPYLAPAWGGVLFGADPVTGDPGRLVLASVAGTPDRLVGGEVDGVQQHLTRRGRLLATDAGHDAGTAIPAHHRHALVRLARRAARVFGRPQDVEWAIDDRGRVWLLQSRPITTVAGPASGPVLGPGPVAETLPEPLSRLEEDLWVSPLREGVAHALVLAGVASRRQIARSPVVTTVSGRVAADLDLLGARPRRGVLRRLDPRPPARRVRAAWRVGRLRAALPSLAADTLRQTDAELIAVPATATLSSAQLLHVLRQGERVLAALHGQEVLMGLLGPGDGRAVAGASVALRALAEGRAAGLSDDDIVARTPVVLALVAPRVGPGTELPGAPDVAAADPAAGDVDAHAVLREALRIRARWVQELMARAAWELGERLALAGVLAAPGQVRLLAAAELEPALRTGIVAGDLDSRAGPTGPPLPAAFRTAPGGIPVPILSASPGDGGRGAGGGRAMGRVHAGPGDPPDGAVLVVTTLDPQLATVLPRLGGLVAETGSVLSHLAILAREFGVPTVVAVPDARRRFPPGSLVVVDGSTGEVARVAETERGAA